jgi:hypothetical protein
MAYQPDTSIRRVTKSGGLQCGIGLPHRVPFHTLRHLNHEAVGNREECGTWS